LDFQLKDKEGDLGTYVTNGEWDLLGRWAPAKRAHEKIFPKIFSLYKILG